MSESGEREIIIDAVHLSVNYKAQFLADVVSGLTREEREVAWEFFDNAITEVLSRYKKVKIDPLYSRYGMDVGFVSSSKKELGNVCYDLASITQKQPSLKDVYFESFDGISNN